MNSCPECKSIDQIRKLSAIVSADTYRSKVVSHASGSIVGEGTSELWRWDRNRGSFGDHRYAGRSKSSSAQMIDVTTTTSSTEQSDLARRLTPPYAPPPLAKLELKIGEAFDLLRIGISVVLAVAVFLAWNELTYDEGVAAGLGIATFFVGYFVVLGLWRARFPFMARQQAKDAYEKDLQEHQQEMALWEKAVDYWGTLFYCARDDVVFDPAGKTVLPASRDDLSDYCWEQALI